MAEITYTKGDILQVKTGIIVHQLGVGGQYSHISLSGRLFFRFPSLKTQVLSHCADKTALPGTALFTVVDKAPLVVATMFSAPTVRDMTYVQTMASTEIVLTYADRTKLPVYIPFGLGCGPNRGNWNTMAKLITELAKAKEHTHLYIVVP